MLAKNPTRPTGRMHQLAKKSRRVVGLAFLLCSLPAAAWGPTGHRVVGHLAEARLTPATRQAVAVLAGPDGLAELGTWADEIRSDPSWRRADPWHYVNIGDGQRYAQAAKNPRGDVIEALGRFEKVLGDSTQPRAARAVALKFIVHLIADVHQPLHVGRKEDRGGNGTAVRWFGRRSNLHRLWDEGLINGTRLSYTEFAGFIDPPSPEQIARWRDWAPADWAYESMDYRRRVYDIGDGALGYEYSFRNMPIVRLRLSQAAVRLAAALNRLLDRPR